jgi:hypothetical protein
MNLWNFKNETRIYWQIKWGEKRKRKRAGVAGLAGFGPATAPQRGSGRFKRRGRGVRAGARASAQSACSRWISSNGHRCSFFLSTRRTSGNPRNWRGFGCSPRSADDDEAWRFGSGGASSVDWWSRRWKQRLVFRRTSTAAETLFGAASSTGNPGTRKFVR